MLQSGSVTFFEHELAVPLPSAALPEGFVVRMATLDDVHLLVSGLPLRTETDLHERFER